MVRVGLDLRATESDFKSHFGRGTGRYASELISHLLALGDCYPDCSIVPVPGESLRGSTIERRLISALPAGRGTVETQVCLPRRIRNAGVDLFHFFAHGDAPAWGNFPFVLTVLDLIPLRFPDLYRAAKEDWRYKLARTFELRAIRKAKGLIAISEATKRDIVEILGIAPERIVVTPLAVNPTFSPLENPTEDEKLTLRKALKFPEQGRVLLYVGGVDPRKNVEFALRIFSQVKGRRNEKMTLVLVGTYQQDKFFPRIENLIKELGLGQDVQLRGYLDDSDLPLAFQASDLTLFPSLYEGFGLPVLESMASGTPVLVGDNSAMPEVVGPRYPLLRDNDIQGWGEAVEAVLDNVELATTMRKEGIEQAGKFTWRHTAELTIEAYHKFSGEAVPRNPSFERQTDDREQRLQRL